MNDRIKAQWKVRRRMAIVAYVFGLVVFPAMYIKYPSLSQIAMAYYGLITVVLGAYYSFATYQDIKADKNDS